jgi:CubicO group peptidase (beta-lactamase class C family)
MKAKVNLDEPVEKYLPEFKGQQVAEAQAAPHPPAHPIIVRELLSHISGIIGPNDPALKHTYVLKEDTAQYGAAPLKWEPGTKYEYNNSGITIVGRIVEVASGMPYGEFVKQRILDPLGMTETTYWPDEKLAARLAQTSQFNKEKGALEDLPNKLDKEWLEQPAGRPHVPLFMRTYNGDALKIYATHYAWPAGGLFSTARDIVKFGQMLLNGGTSHGQRYLSADAVQSMTSNQNGNITVGPKVTYGLTLMIKSHPEEGLSTGSFGHIGARGPVLFIDPHQGLVLILLSESSDIQTRGEPRGTEQSNLRSSFFRAAIEKYGRAEKE